MQREAGVGQLPAKDALSFGRRQNLLLRAIVSAKPDMASTSQVSPHTDPTIEL